MATPSSFIPDGAPASFEPDAPTSFVADSGTTSTATNEADALLAAQTPITGTGPSFMTAPAPSTNPRDIALESRERRGPEIGSGTPGEPIPDPDERHRPSLLSEIGVAPVGLGTFSKLDGKTISPGSELARARDLAAGEGRAPIGLPTLSSELLSLLPEGKIKDLSTGAYNAAAGLFNFFISPMGVATLGIGGLPPMAQKAVTATFAYDMAKNAPEELAAGDEAMKQGDIQGATQHWLSGAAAMGFAVGAGKHTISPIKPKAPPVISPELEQLAPQTARAVEETLKPNEPKPADEAQTPATVSEVTTPAEATAEVKAPAAADVANEVNKPSIATTELKDAPVVFDSMFLGKPMFRATAEFSLPGLEGPAQTIGSKVSLDALQKAGLKVPEAEMAKATAPALPVLIDDGSADSAMRHLVRASNLLAREWWTEELKERKKTALELGKPADEPVAMASSLSDESRAQAVAARATMEAKRKLSNLYGGDAPITELSAQYNLNYGTPEELYSRSLQIINAKSLADLVEKTTTPTAGVRAAQRKSESTGGQPSIPNAPKEPIAAAGETTPVGVEQTPAAAGIEPQGAISGVPPAMSPIPQNPLSKPPKSQREIITALAKGLGVPIRFGRLRTNKFAGYFLEKANLIGSKRANDIPLTSHEVGHKLDAMFDISSNPSIRSELDRLGDPSTAGSLSSWTKSKTQKYKMGEGLAEFVRHWLVDPAKAKTDAPNTFAEFNRILDANKDAGDVMRQAQEDIQVWRTAEPQARLRSHISVGENPNKTRYTLSQLTRDLVDDLNFLRLAVDDAKALSKTDIPPSQNPYLLARNLRGSYGMAGTFISDGVVDFKTKAVTLGKSLEDALKPVAGRINDFRDWIVAKRAQELHKQGKETGLVDSDVTFTASKFDNDPAFKEAFTKVKAWNEALIQYAEDSGLITKESHDGMRSLHQDHVPFHRLFEVGAGESPSTESSGIGRGLNVGKPGSLKRQYGSRRDIVDPLETMVKNAYVIITASEKAAINRAVGQLAGREGMGKWVEHVSTPKELVRVELERIREQLENEGADLTNVPDDLLMSFFRLSKQAPFGENIIRTVENGESKFYRLNKDLFDTFHALDLEDSGKLIKILASPAQLLRAGVTLAPDFALANAIRDTVTAGILSKYGALPFQVTFRGVEALINNPKLVAEWKAAGGKSSIEATYFDRDKLQSFLRDKITKELTPAEQALVYAKSPLVALRWLTGISEEATRIGEYKAAFDSLVKSGMPEGEARRLAAFEARDRQDFAKGGSKTKIVRHLAAFWNAALQGNVRLANAFKRRPIQTTLLGLSFITIPKLIEQAVNWDDQDYWDRPQWERDAFFMIPIGKGRDNHTQFIRIPTPFILGVIFGTFPGRIIQWAKENSPDAMKGFPALMLKEAVPNPIPQALQTIFADFLSGKKGWDIWRGRTVVPESLANKAPEDQWTEQTSLTARKLGAALKFSPMKIDHIINSTLGGVGRQLTHQAIDRGISLVTGDKAPSTAVPGGRFVSTPAVVASQSIDDVYTIIETLKTEKERKASGKSITEDISWLPVFERTARQLSELRKRARRATSDSQRQAINEQMITISRSLVERYRTGNKTSIQNLN